MEDEYQRRKDASCTKIQIWQSVIHQIWNIEKNSFIMSHIHRAPEPENMKGRIK